MKEVQQEIFEAVKRLKIDCPACASMTDDAQYTCMTCWNEGADGKINVLAWIAENWEAISKEVHSA